MKCPVCKDITLLMMDKNWVEIDYCPECRWIWLDRWELEKLIQAEKWYNKWKYQNENDDEEYDINNNKIDDNNPKNKRKRSFFENFDFFD